MPSATVLISVPSKPVVNECQFSEGATSEIMRHLVGDDKWRMDDALWARVRRFIPIGRPGAQDAVHGKHRPRIDDRIIMDAILIVLRARCHWKALDHHWRLCSGSTAHRRCREWVRVGVFHELRRAGVLDLDALRDIDWTRVER